MSNQNNDSVVAPFTDDQVQNMRNWQTCGFVHKLTCKGSEYCDRKGTCSRTMLVYNEKLVCSCGQTEQTIVPAMVANFSLSKYKEANEKFFPQLKDTKEISPEAYQQIVDQSNENVAKMTPEALIKNLIGIKLDAKFGSLHPDSVPATFDLSFLAVVIEDYLNSPYGIALLASDPITDVEIEKAYQYIKHQLDWL